MTTNHATRPPHAPFDRPRAHRRPWRACAFAGALALAGCGDVAGAPEQPDAGDDSPVPPTLTVMPDTGARGVLVTDPIVLTFSQPMDTASVEAAWSSTSLSPEALELTWDAGGTVLTVDASAVLEYPVGGRDVDPFTYAFTLATTATDADGVPLAAAFTTSFETARDVSFGLGRLTSATGSYDGSATGVDIRVGDTASNGTWRGFITLDLTALPTIVQMTSATVSVRQTSVAGVPYTNLGNLRMVHLAPITAIDLAAYQASSVGEVGTLSTTAAVGDPGGDRSLDILDEIAADATAGNAASTFRVEFETAYDLGGEADHVIFDPTSVDARLRALAE